MTAPQLLQALDVAFRRRLGSLLSDGFDATRLAWLANTAHIGARIEVNGTTGIMLGLADDGALVLQLVDGSVAHVRAGEISLLS